MEVKIVSKENIKPATRTPSHLRAYKLSAFDQIAPPIYTTIIFFYLNDQSANIQSIISDRSKHLKQSLSQVLPGFYPLAGKLKNDNLQVDCNDEGLYYVETRVNCSLPEFLNQPIDDQMVKRFIPQNAPKASSGLYVMMIQVNFFSCGGTAITFSVSHKVMDGSTGVTFLKAWTKTAHGSSEIIYPNFTGSSLFPQIPSLLYNPRNMASQSKPVTRRFVFEAPAIATLKAKTRLSSGKELSDVEVVTALIWKCAAEAAQKPFNLDLIVNLRGKNSLPKNLMGNYFWHGIAQCKLNELELHHLVDLIKKSKTDINRDFVEAIKSDVETFKKSSELIKDSRQADTALLVTALYKTGMSDTDFGWGKPARFYYCNPGRVNFIVLNDTRYGDGIEAMVTLTEQDMEIFKNDPEFLSFISLKPSRL